MQVAPENTGIALFPEEDDAVGAGLEPSVNPAFKGLAGLGIMVVNKRDGLGRARTDQRIPEQIPEVILAGAVGGTVKMKVQRSVEEVHAFIDLGEIGKQGLKV